MKHLLDIKECTQADVVGLINRAESFRKHTPCPQFPHETVANLFYENSTRTRVSFQMAANRLAMPVINLEIQHSAEMKGESPEDTFLNLVAMGIRCFVLRHRDETMPKRLAALCDDNIHVINAGDGKRAHPTQALLDMMTILQHKSDLSKVKVVVVGNIRHSRVASSFQTISQLMGLGQLVFVCPEEWHPQSLQYGEVMTDLDSAVQDADVVMGLRIQRERFDKDETIDEAAFRKQFAITAARVALAKPDAIVMHPGPVNRGMEMDNDVIDGPQSRILQQVSNGVFIRMAVLESVLAGS